MKTTRSTPILHVQDVAKSLKFYREMLGFESTFEHEGYVGIQLGEGGFLHVSSRGNQPVGAGTAYFFCDEVDTYYGKIKGKGAETKNEPQDYPYGMRDFTVVDPDGNHLTFGCALVKK